MSSTVVGIIALMLAFGSGAAMLLYFFMPSSRSLKHPAGRESKSQKRAVDPDMSRLRKKKAKAQELTLEEKFFHAGMFGEDERRLFSHLKLAAPFVGLALFLIYSLSKGNSIQMVLMQGFIGFYIGFKFPDFLLRRRIKIRNEEIMYYLPLAIEQIVIGVSSSLDVGPCMQRVVQMADERDSHNAVTELFRVSQLHMKSGVSMEEALTEVGKLSGHTELKHAFMALAQVARHGGEITKQLQELADAVASQRETKIEAKIKKLELEATGPVGLVFMGFLFILLIGLGANVMKAFQ